MLFVDLSFFRLVAHVRARVASLQTVVVLTDREHMPLSDLPNLLCYEELLALQPGATLLLYAARGRLLLLGGRLVQTGCMLLQNWACAATSFAQPHTKPCISTNYDLAPYAMSQPIYSLSTHLPVPQYLTSVLGIP